MKKNTLIYLLSVILLLLVGCKKDYDTPPLDGEDPTDIIVNTTIREIKRLYDGGDAVKIEDDLIFKAIVVADDRSGNFFRTLILQGEEENKDSSGIAVIIDATNLYNDFPIGRRVFVKAKGLHIGQFNNLVQLGSEVSPTDSKQVTRIPELLIKNYFIKGKFNIAVEPLELTINELNNKYQNVLIKIKNVEFSSESVCQNYADAIDKVSKNHNLKDCSSKIVLLRNSGFADFASAIIPAKNGDITAILSVFNTDFQLYIRNLDDVQFAQERCTGGGPFSCDSDTTPVVEIATIKELRDLFTSTSVTVGKGKITGVVISDRASANLDGRNLYMQRGEYGIAIRFSANHSFDLGDEIEIDVEGGTLSKFNQLLQLEIANAKAKKLGSGTLPTPRVTTIAQIATNQSSWESTLVKISNVAITGTGTKYSNANLFNDGTGTASTFIRLSAVFSDNTFPANAENVTAIVSNFNGLQLLLRKESDVVAGVVTIPSITIQQLRSQHTGSTVTASSGKITGVVISDRNALNIVERNITLQQGEYGIVVRFPSNHSFNLGDEVEVDVTGGSLSRFFGLLQLEVNNDKATKKGTGTLPAPRVTTAAQIASNINNWESTLVKIENATINGNGAKYSNIQTFSDVSGSINSFVRTQATFANNNFPINATGIVGIASVSTDPQMLIRNESDVIASAGPALITVETLRGLYTSGTVTLSNVKIKGVVISDRAGNNLNNRNLFLQQGNFGISVRVSAVHTYDLGDELEIDLDGASLLKFNQLLQVEVNNAKVTKLSSGATLPTPRVATIAQINTNINTWESTLVKISNVTFSGSGTKYKDLTTITDASGNVAAFVRNDATFGETNLPNGASEIITIISNFDNPQLLLRNLGDVINPN